MTVPRREFLRAIVALTIASAAAIAPSGLAKPMQRLPDIGHWKNWKNYTCVYSPIDKEVLIQRMKKCMRDRKFSDKGIIP